eukprot:CAMPEP_0171069486 /NCGR_PEP_ID=MMETSP0766_2-20121228/9180_1 /TAXON_ID=439317 /ORGANISM="Gambierdiscus australes, Strain CAWD 149" /LENGTH=84 /DNA_ID=CAMNT_0011525875 /DNA_START=32 /DNA_END=286 /DNA_ORIENTATION=+
MAVLPIGNDSIAGVAAAEGCVRLFQKFQELHEADLAKRDGLQTYAQDLWRSCDPTLNPASCRLCQAAAAPAVEGLLAVLALQRP